MRKYLTTLVAVVCLTAGAATVAGATEPPTQSADASVCGEVTLSGTPGQYDGDYLLHWFVEEDTANAGNFGLPGSDTLVFDEDYGDGEIRVVYWVTGPESDENLDPEEVTVDTDCTDPVPTTEPVDETPPADEPVETTTTTVAADPVANAPVAPAATAVVATPSFTG